MRGQGATLSYSNEELISRGVKVRFVSFCYLGKRAVCWHGTAAMALRYS